jgi:hypothetical protein
VAVSVAVAVAAFPAVAVSVYVAVSVFVAVAVAVFVAVAVAVFVAVSVFVIVIVLISGLIRENSQCDHHATNQFRFFVCRFCRCCKPREQWKCVG